MSLCMFDLILTTSYITNVHMHVMAFLQVRSSIDESDLFPVQRVAGPDGPDITTINVRKKLAV